MKVVKNTTYFSAVLLLFLGASALHYMGYLYVDEEGSMYQKLHPSFFIMFLAIIFVIMHAQFERLYVRKKIEFQFLLFIICLILYVYVNKLTGSIAFIPNTIILPVFFSICICEEDVGFLLKLRRLVLIFFVINSSMALLEMILQYNFFPLSSSTFRSTALQNHPLNNALVTSTIMAFILMSEMKNKIKNILLSLGLASIVCYGARGALLVWLVMVFVYLIKSAFFIRGRNPGRMTQIIAIVLIVAGVSWIVVYTSWGTRIMQTLDLSNDSSVAVRLDTLDIFNRIDLKDLLWGGGANKMENIAGILGVGIIENFWIIWIIRFGLVMTIILSVTLIKFMYQKTKAYGKFASFYTLMTCLAIAATNNSLGSNTPVISIFVICAYAFTPVNNKLKNNYATLRNVK
jgi:hypothetical protein